MAKVDVLFFFNLQQKISIMPQFIKPLKPLSNRSTISTFKVKVKITSIYNLLNNNCIKTLIIFYN